MHHRPLHILVAMPPHLLGYLNDIILLLILTIRLWWCVKVVFIRRDPTDHMLGHPPVPEEGLVDALSKIMGVISLMGGRDEHIVPVLDHAQRQYFREGPYGCV